MHDPLPATDAPGADGVDAGPPTWGELVLGRYAVASAILCLGVGTHALNWFLVATAVPNTPAESAPDISSPRSSTPFAPNQNELPSATAIVRIGMAVFSNPMASPAMMFVAGPVRDASTISLTGRYFVPV